MRVSRSSSSLFCAAHGSTCRPTSLSPPDMFVPGSSEPRKLGLVGKVLVALMVVVTAGLGVGAVVAVRAKRIEDEERRNLEYALGVFRSVIVRETRADAEVPHASAAPVP